MEMAVLRAVCPQTLIRSRGHRGCEGDECGSPGLFVGWKKLDESSGMRGGTTAQCAGGKLRHSGCTQGQVGGPVHLFGEQYPGGVGTALPGRAAEPMATKIMLKTRQWLCCW